MTGLAISACSHIVTVRVKTLMQGAARLGGGASSRRVAPMYWNIRTNWASTAMRLACASKTDKKLSIEFTPSEIICLSELLKDNRDLQSITIYGEQPLAETYALMN